jgi:hypothetical protein
MTHSGFEVCEGIMQKDFIGRIALAGVAVVVSSVDVAAAGRGGFLAAIVGRSAGYAAGSAAGVATQSARGNATPTVAPKVYDDEHLTLQQLEQCVVQAKTLDGTGSDIDIRANNLDQASREISAAQDELEAKRTSLKRTDAKRVAAFNAGIRSYNERVENQRAAVAAYKTAESSFNESVGTYNTSCARKYYVDDMNAIRQKLGMQ